jgi:uncharacterized protein YkwD
MVLAVVFASCKESPTDTPTNTNPTTVTGLSALYDQLPNPGACSAGSLKSSERTRVLQYINAIRARHGLGAVSYRPEDDSPTAAAALICVANQVLDHNPPSSYSCWSQIGADACAKSDLGFFGWSGQSQIPSSEGYVELWLRDSLVENLGHRRWILNPFLRHIAFGRVDREQGSGISLTGTSAAALKVIYDDDLAGPANGTPGFVAYPFESYPAGLFNPGLDLSFSVVASTTSYWENQKVDFSSAVISMTRDGAQVSIPSVESGNDAAGLPNIIHWKADVVRGERYDVHIRGVRIDGTSHDYDYWFQLQ